MDLDFKIFKPQGLLTDQIQAIWSVTVECNAEQPVRKQLLSDACTGVTFILQNKAKLNDLWFSPGVVLLPVSTQAQQVNLPPGTVMAGVRFHPAVGFQLFGERLEQPQRVEGNDPLSHSILTAFAKLKETDSPLARISALYRWSSALIAECEPQNISHIIQHEPNALSQRHRERQFKKWLGMTPKYYQRVLRVKQTLEQLKAQPDMSLADLAIEQGFSDQPHMTRECKQIAQVTPKQFVRERTL